LKIVDSGQWRQQDLTTTMKAYVIDVIRLKDVDDVIAGTGLMSEHLMIKHSQTETVTFISKSES
jgi:neurofibromin 1